MQTIFSTAGIPPAEAFDAWMDIARANFSHHEAQPLHRPSFFARLDIGSLADLGVMRWQIAPEIASHPGLDADSLLLLLPLNPNRLEFAGRPSFEVNGQTAALLDLRKPHRALALEASKALGISIPRAALAQRILPDGAINQAITLAPDALLLRGLVSRIISIGPSQLSNQAAAAVRDHLLDLLALIVGRITGIMPKLGSASVRSLARNWSANRERIFRALHQSGLSDSAIAETMEISRRAAIGKRQRLGLRANPGNPVGRPKPNRGPVP